MGTIRAHDDSIRALRDVDESTLERHRDELELTDYARALHVVLENERTIEMAATLRAGDTSKLARLMAGSHDSLRTLYEVSSPELDRIVEVATAYPACRGARMTGAGFGGCAVALVDSENVEAFAEHVRETYGTGDVYVCHAVSGAQILE